VETLGQTRCDPYLWLTLSNSRTEKLSIWDGAESKAASLQFQGQGDLRLLQLTWAHTESHSPPRNRLQGLSLFLARPLPQNPEHGGELKLLVKQLTSTNKSLFSLQLMPLAEAKVKVFTKMPGAKVP
jgi:hypothetical protein